MNDAKLAQMGTHQYTRGRPGQPMPRGGQPAPSTPHPRQAEIDRRIEGYEAIRNKHDGLHRPGAIHSRGGRA